MTNSLEEVKPKWSKSLEVKIHPSSHKRRSFLEEEAIEFDLLV